MKAPLKYLPIVALAIVALTWPSTKVTSTGEEEEAVEEDQAAREAFRRLQLQDENGQIPPNALFEALQQKQEMEFLPEAWGEFQQVNAPDVPGWVSIGPGNIGGRIRSIIIHPTNPATMWLGAVAGGVWKTTNGGASWSTNTDFLANLAVTCMAIDPANPNILYAGTGEGFANADYVRGRGIYKTQNGGTTWEVLPSTVPDDQHPLFFWVNRLAVSPTDSQLLLASTQFSVARSVNGGVSWVEVLGGLGHLDVVFQPQSTSGTQVPETPGIKCVAGTVNGAYYSNDSGQTWTGVTGLPASPGRVELAYARSNPSIVYALAAANATLYRSDNGGSSFQPRGTPPGKIGLSTYNNTVWVDPTNPDTVLIGGANLWRTTDGGLEWTKQNSRHPDHHVIVAHPGYDGVNNRIVYEGNDGGIYRTTDVLAEHVTWEDLNNNLAITQFYGGAGNVASGTIVGGAQDQGTVRFRPQDGSENWHIPYDGDGGFCAADQTDPNYFYGEYIYLQIYRSTDGANTAYYIKDGLTDANSQGANFIAPFVLDPNNPNTLLAGGRSLWRSKNVKDSPPDWSTIKPPVIASGNISAIMVAPGNSNVVWVGYNDGSVYRTANATASAPTWIQSDAGLPHGRMCTRITIAPPSQAVSAQQDTEDPQVGSTVYVTFGGFSNNNVWKTTNSGATWTDAVSGVGSGHLPPAPVFSLVVSPSNPARLYVGTEIGVFSSIDSGMHWSPGAPDVGGPANTRVDELFWMGNKLVAATHGRGMFTIGN
jgi:photosystem II stability/assembly factor-like uncharacterized protein